MKGTGKSKRSWIVLLACASYRHPWRALALTFFLTVGLGSGARYLSINPDISQLLPPHFESVKRLDELRTRVGGIGSLNLVISGASEAKLRAFVDRLAPKVESIDEVQYVTHRRPINFFDERALYYLETEDLETIQKRFSARETYERLNANPLYIDLEEEGPPSLDMSDILSKYEEEGGPQKSRDTHYWDAKRNRIVVFVKPSELASNIDFARDVHDRVMDVVDSMPERDSLKIETAGRYQKVVDLKAVIETDLKWASILAISLMALFLYLHFRRLSLVLAVALPLLLGLLWTYGFAGWTLRSLNILTAFLGAILLGVGIDIGIHLLDRLRESKAAGQERITEAYAQAGRASTIATLTTVLGFATLSLSDFRVFREFGILSSCGLTCILVAYLAVLPALLHFLDSHLRDPRSENERPSHKRFGKTVKKQAAWCFWLTSLALFGATQSAGEVRFNYDFSSLDPSNLRSFQLDREISDYLGFAQTPLMIMTESASEAKAVGRTLRKRSEEQPKGTSIQKVAIGAELVPPKQTEKRAIIDELVETLELIDPETLSDDERKELDDLLERTKATPFDYDDLPIELRRSFHAADGSGEFVVVFPSVALSDGTLIRNLANELRDLPRVGEETISATGEPMVLADVLDSVFRETPRSVMIAGAVILLVLVLFLGSARQGILCLAPALLTLLGTVGLMPFVGLEFNYLNIIVLPVLLGISVDGASHLLSRMRHGGDIALGLGTTGHSVTSALTTTALGFVSFSFANHPGLQSIGKLALLGLAMNLLMTLLWLPGAILLWGRNNEYRATQGFRALHLTVLRAGRAGTGPGTLGAVFALPLAYFMADLSPLWWALILGSWTAFATWQADHYERGSDGGKDPQEVVLDETLGCLTTLAFVPFELPWVLAGFVLFRAFDILKPGPVGLIDRRAPGGYGIMLDDIAAGLLAGALLFGLQRLLAIL